ncbi:4-hydroxythreonine-4-phosphate dehydrogenase PdxA [Candidatus Pantoea edessiphila]|uniref:4-hydroxythreonine-4-phosphate dehydrogenase n=1 Tax=Candidatus Pantoea edessiphila TaxID=2044610 RepID=A0A2P5SY70_9GAMM|nr:4-hydroxythreonine-4-phosphate dehydrogenase PdxA [Candidatus Pantoea edessiphila]MBK4775603.1 4-hydroxythreonine-4-phosphate dehydrogenase PdxA [Pantoea sp. Edef]PPI87252.1 4-hydroxythreonine-4-phosphate dehydrogenase PdxA [Candidatus Pantoea edessiphila]
MTNNSRIIITPGEPAGIGPDIIIQLAQRNWPVELVVCASPKLLNDRAAQLNLPLNLYNYHPDIVNKNRQVGNLAIIPIELSNPVTPGQLSIANSRYVIKTLIKSCNECIKGKFQAIVTGPVNKYIINNAGIPFTGHTELFARLASAKQVVMMLVNKKFRVALATTHIPLKSVSNFITKKHLYKIIYIIYEELQKKFFIKNPSIYICGLNPHAGDGGYIGTEEIETIIPVINELNMKGLKLTGPISADTIFQEKILKKADVILAMYHDQGLPVLKSFSFTKSVNVTLGLPFIRTSVDHGTALELASTGNANPESLFMALNLAIDMIEINNE